MDYINSLFLGYLPYIAVTAFFIGVLYHCFVSGKNIRATSTIFLEKDWLIKWGSPLFHYGIILVFFGHVFGLFTPPFIIEWFMPLETKRMLAISIGLFAGFFAFIGLSMLCIRKFVSNRIHKTSSFQDYFIVFLILVQIALGLLSTYTTTKGTLEEYLAFDYWVQGIVWFEPNVWHYILEADIIYKLHIVNGFFIFIIFPYTKLMHMIKAPFMFTIRPNKTFNSESITDKL